MLRLEAKQRYGDNTQFFINLLINASFISPQVIVKHYYMYNLFLKIYVKKKKGYHLHRKIKNKQKNRQG